MASSHLSVPIQLGEQEYFAPWVNPPPVEPPLCLIYILYCGLRGPCLNSAPSAVVVWAKLILEQHKQYTQRGPGVQG